MSVEIAWKQNILVTDFHLLKSLLVVDGFGSQAFVCGFSRQNINSAFYEVLRLGIPGTLFFYKSENQKNVQLLFFLSRLAKYSWEPKLKGIFEIL